MNDKKLVEITGRAIISVFQKYAIYLIHKLLDNSHSFKPDLKWGSFESDGELCYFTEIEPIVPIRKKEGFTSFDIRFLQTFYEDWKSKTFTEETSKGGFKELDGVVRYFGEVLNLVAGESPENPLHQKMHGIHSQLIKFHFFTTIHDDGDFYISLWIKKSDCEKKEWLIHPTFWKQITRTKFTCPECGNDYSIKEFQLGKDGMCQKCFCKNECDFFHDCYTNNSDRAEELLIKLEDKFKESGWMMEGKEFNPRRKDYDDCYVSFILSDGNERHACEMSVMFFVNDEGEINEKNHEKN